MEEIFPSYLYAKSFIFCCHICHTLINLWIYVSYELQRKDFICHILPQNLLFSLILAHFLMISAHFFADFGSFLSRFR